MKWCYMDKKKTHERIGKKSKFVKMWNKDIFKFHLGYISVKIADTEIISSLWCVLLKKWRIFEQKNWTKNVFKCGAEIKSSKRKGRNLGKDVETVQKQHNYGRERKHWKFLFGNAKWTQLTFLFWIVYNIDKCFVHTHILEIAPSRDKN